MRRAERDEERINHFYHTAYSYLFGTTSLLEADLLKEKARQALCYLPEGKGVSVHFLSCSIVAVEENTRK